MLNCTDLECILHHHHYYEHLHQLQPHLPPDHERDVSTAVEDVGDGSPVYDNETNPPVDSVYMICGVLIAMVLVGVIIVLLAVTISKLRKREDHSNSVHPEPPVVQTATPISAIVTPSAPSITPQSEGPCTTDLGNATESELTYTTTTGQFIWQFPPPYPPPHTPPPQYTLYNNDQDTLVHGLSSDRPGFAKGFRKNLGGHWRRLVKRKPETETCAIPPELKDQLKTIYVY
ncbi:uncharacterized protein LOC107272877 isoform X5 [Cephus cinctus]|uniref:Uncharacterized protein LOC107272877 isoform X5 n=1 Tax=Cephus cinctus TaxID=211228 RepID=A0AAJ7CAU4_CEPCN|nr:uncharacterized protein LOC107272877 isoform X5 [Cephus cinctus]